MQQILPDISGEIAISDDGTLAAVLSPVGPLVFPEQDLPSSLDFFDLKNNRHLKSIILQSWQVRFLPGTHRIVTAPGRWKDPDGAPGLYNLETRLFDLDTYEQLKAATIPYPSALFGGLAVGLRQ